MRLLGLVWRRIEKVLWGTNIGAVGDKYRCRGRKLSQVIARVCLPGDQGFSAAPRIAMYALYMHSNATVDYLLGM